MAESKADLGAALLKVLGSPITLPLGGASPEEHAAARGEAEFIAGMRLTRPEPEVKHEPDDTEHERRMVEHTITSFRARADAAENESIEAYLADQTHREADLRGEATRLRAVADRHEASLRVRDRRKGEP